jgi:peptide deformylase
MSEFITFNTEENQTVEPLPLYGEDFSMLSKRMPEVSSFGFDTITLARRLNLTRRLYSGIGLSANQCGIPMRAFVIGTEDFELVCFNPKVLTMSEDVVKDKEGCLSFPALFMTVPRPSWIEVSFQNEFGDEKQMRLEGITARCFLHELDHLNGVRFVDRVGNTTLMLARKKQQKILKRYKRMT